MSGWTGLKSANYTPRQLDSATNKLIKLDDSALLHTNVTRWTSTTAKPAQAVADSALRTLIDSVDDVILYFDRTVPLVPRIIVLTFGDDGVSTSWQLRALRDACRDAGLCLAERAIADDVYNTKEYADYTFLGAKRERMEPLTKKVRQAALPLTKKVRQPPTRLPLARFGTERMQQYATLRELIGELSREVERHSASMCQLASADIAREVEWHSQQIESILQDLQAFNESVTVLN